MSRSAASPTLKNDVLVAVGSTLPNNLPAQGSSFVGRAHELERLDHLRHSHRLVTIVGLGGMGKTRLALQYASAALSEFPNGAWLVTLKEVSDPSRIAVVTAEALGVPDGDGSVQGRLFEHLRKARALLVLDNAEHLTKEVSSFVLALLDATSDVYIIVTSREVLQVKGEHVLRLGGIDDGLKLFTDRAYPQQPDHELAPDVANAVANICVRLQGVPLAIELAAARAPSIRPDKLADTLEQLCEASTTLEQMIDWSYQLLDADERRVFDALALFEGTFSLEAAEAVAGVSGVEGPVLVTSLVNKSLVASIGSAGTGGYYYFLDVVRDYARVRLGASVDRASATQRYVDYYLHFVDSLDAPNISDSELIGAVDREWTNLAPALRHALDGDSVATRVHAAIRALLPFWKTSGREREGILLIERALQRSGLSDGERVELLDSAAHMAASSENFAELEPLAEQLIVERERGGNPKLLGDALLMLGHAKHMLGAYDVAPTYYERAMTQFEISGSRRGVALVLGTLGAIIEQRTVADEGDLGEARRLLELSLAIFRDEQVPVSCAQVLENLGVVCMRAGHIKEALAYTKEGLALYRQYGNNERSALAHISLADVYLAAKEPLEALAALQTGRRLIGDQARGLFVAYYAEYGFKTAVALNALRIAGELYGFGRRYRQVICIPRSPAEQAVLTSGYQTLVETLGTGLVEQLAQEGGALDLSDIDALLDQASIDARPASTARSRPKTPATGPLPATGKPQVDRRDLISRLPVLQRGRVSLRIQEAAAYPAVFVTANGAWGKSIALSHYLATNDLEPLRVRVVENATLASFLRAFCAVIDPTSTSTDRNESHEQPGPLLARRLSGYRGAIVIDDLHHGDGDRRISQVIFEIIAATESGVQWFLLSRHIGQAPLGTCRAYGFAGEPIGERDLAFTVDDTIDYAALMRMTLSVADAETIVNLTDGWPVAITLALQAQLAATAMAPVERRAYVERETETSVAFYLHEQVFGALSAYQQRFLLTASAMPGDVRVDVLRHLDLAAEHTVTSLVKRVPMRLLSDGVFRIPRLFKLFLQSELSAWPDRREVCTTLAEAYERVGDPVAAVKVLLYIADFEMAVDVLVNHLQAWANADWPELLEAVVSQVPAKLLESNPAMLLVRASLADRHNRLNRALELLERAGKSSDVGIVARAACVEAALRLNNGQLAVVQTLEDALLLLSDDEATQLLRTKALLCCAYVDENRGLVAHELLEDIRRELNGLVLNEENIDVLYWAALGYYRLGDYNVATDLAARITGSHGTEPWLILAQAHELLAQIALQTGAPLEQILNYRNAAIAMARVLKTTRLYSALLAQHCALLFVSGDVEHIKVVMDESVTQGSHLWASYSAAFRVLTNVSQGARAESVERAMVAYAAVVPMVRALREDPVLASASSLVLACDLLVSCMANDAKVKDAINQHLDDSPALGDAALGGVPAMRRDFDILSLVAVGCQSLFGEQQSMAWLASRLDQRASDPVVEAVRTVVRPIVYGRRARTGQKDAVSLIGVADALEYLHWVGYGLFAMLLESLAKKAASTSHATGVALSKAELEILVELAKGIKPKDIADARVVSQSTVRSQIKTLYVKLDVKSAQAAVARAHAAGLLPPT